MGLTFQDWKRDAPIIKGLFTQGRHEDALNAAKRWSDTYVNHSDSARLLGNMQAMLGRVTDAAESFKKAIQHNEADSESLFNLALCEMQLGQMDSAAKNLEHYTALRPGDENGWLALAQVLTSLGKAASALELIDSILMESPGHTGALMAKANSLTVVGRPKEALSVLATVEKSAGFDPALAVLKGDAYFVLSKFQEALSAYEMALEPGRKNLEIVEKIVSTHNALTNFESALSLAAEARNTWPQSHELSFQSGLAANALGRYSEAVNHYQAALDLSPNTAKTWSNLGVAKRNLGEVASAIACFDRAIVLDPNLIEATWNKSLALLMSGDFQHGWKFYECRWNLKTFSSPPRALRQPLWLGGDISGQTILIHAEQGLGTTIQFCRYAAEVSRLYGANVILEVDPCLVDLIKTLEGVQLVIGRGNKLPSFDLQTPMLSLPLALGADVHSIPLASGYLSASSDLTSKWCQKIDARFEGPGPRIGLVWRGSMAQVNDPRVISLENIISLVKSFPHVQWVSLQKDPTDTERQMLSDQGIWDIDDSLESFAQTAAVCKNLTSVISVDTSVAHLCGALSVETHVLLAHAADWRWFINRLDCPWYQSVCLYRQEIPYDWSDVLGQLEGVISKKLSSPDYAN